MGTELFITVGVFPVELLACLVSMVCSTNWPVQIGRNSTAGERKVLLESEW